MRHLNAIQITIVVAAGPSFFKWLWSLDLDDNGASILLVGIVWLFVVVWNINANFVALDKRNQ